MRFLYGLFFIFSLSAYADELSDWVGSHRKITTHPFKVYHWATRGGKDLKVRPNYDEAISAKRDGSQDGSLELTPPELEKYFKKMTGMFSKVQDNHTWAVGDGLYAAFDPIQSIMYAGKRWALVEISVERPIYYLDIPQDENFIDFEGKKVGRRELMSRRGKLGKRFAKVLKEFEISILRYNWNGVVFSGCGPRREAYAFIRPELLDEGIELKIFVENHPKDVHTMNEYQRIGEKISYVLNESKKDFQYFIGNRTNFEIWLKSLIPSDQVTKDELKAESFECGSPYSL